ncbi:unnamed protein product, partial [Ectocarpus sp. 13 AM-2016]
QLLVYVRAHVHLRSAMFTGNCGGPTHTPQRCVQPNHQKVKNIPLSHSNTVHVNAGIYMYLVLGVPCYMGSAHATVNVCVHQQSDAASWSYRLPDIPNNHVSRE